jgi:threonine dehydrogenase-like Zn-dependent dehydrogenase
MRLDVLETGHATHTDLPTGRWQVPQLRRRAYGVLYWVSGLRSWLPVIADNRRSVNPGFAGGAYGYVAMGPYQGGQAQYLRVPFADFNALKLPKGTEHEADFILLADIFPTGWHGLVLAGFQSGESVAVFGAGPVGLMAAYSGILRGASKVFVVDTVPERLQAAEKIGCIPIDFRKSDPVEQIIKLNDGMVDRAVDAVGYQAVDASGSKEKPNIVLDQLIMVTRPTGGLGIPGLYVPADPGAPDEQSRKGQILISFGKLFEKVRSCSFRNNGLLTSCRASLSALASVT